MGLGVGLRIGGRRAGLGVGMVDSVLGVMLCGISGCNWLVAAVALETVLCFLGPFESSGRGRLRTPEEKYVI